MGQRTNQRMLALYSTLETIWTVGAGGVVGSLLA